MDKILIINTGSSSIKYQLVSYDTLEPIVSGLCERIFVDGNFIAKYSNQKDEIATEMKDHEQALNFMLDYFMDKKFIENKTDIKVIGHRVVHGGNYIKNSVIIDDEILKIIEKCIPIAPLHNEPELKVIKVAMKVFGNAKHVGVFDTSFHQSIPPHHHMYAIPSEWYKKYGIKRYGFHGTSYAYINSKMEEILNKKNLNLVICHLGSGASMCAVKNGKSVNTSMGFTPSEGLVMGTRAGNVDAGMMDYIENELKIKAKDCLNTLNKKSGMIGMCGYSDFREINNNISNQDVKQAYDVYIQRVTDYLIRYMNDLEGKIDAIVFTGGVGENDEEVRQNVTQNIKLKSLVLDHKLNNQKYGDYLKISTDASDYPIYVVRTNEEKMIAADSKKLFNEFNK